MGTLELIALIQVVITFLVGVFIFVLYIWQKTDAKRTAARIIAVEISGAEDRIKALKVKFTGYMQVTDLFLNYSKDYDIITVAKLFWRPLLKNLFALAFSLK